MADDLNDPKHDPTLTNQAYQKVAGAADAAYQQLPAADAVKAYVPEPVRQYVPALAPSGQTGSEQQQPRKDSTEGSKEGATITSSETQGQSDPPHQSAAHSPQASSTSPDESTLGKRKTPGPKDSGGTAGPRRSQTGAGVPAGGDGASGGKQEAGEGQTNGSAVTADSGAEATEDDGLTKKGKAKGKFSGLTAKLRSLVCC